MPIYTGPTTPFSFMDLVGNFANLPASNTQAGFDPATLEEFPQASAPPVNAAAPGGYIPPNVATGLQNSVASLLPAPQRPLAGRLTDPLTNAWRSLVTQKTGLRYGTTPTGSQAWFPPQAGENWLGGGIAGVDPNTGQNVYNPLGYGQLLEPPQGSQRGKLADAFRSLYNFMSGRQFGVTPSGEGYFSPVPGEHWLGGGIAGIDPRSGQNVYNPLGYVPFNQQAQGIADRGGFFGATISSQLPSFSGFLPAGSTGGGPYWHLIA